MLQPTLLGASMAILRFLAAVALLAVIILGTLALLT
jgi:hypothetical protein